VTTQDSGDAIMEDSGNPFLRSGQIWRQRNNEKAVLGGGKHRLNDRDEAKRITGFGCRDDQADG
jgi:hypothetical protein